MRQAVLPHTEIILAVQALFFWWTQLPAVQRISSAVFGKIREIFMSKDLALLLDTSMEPQFEKATLEKALLIAIYEDETMTIPHGETVIRAGQSILAFADEDSMKELNRVFGSGE